MKVPVLLDLIMSCDDKPTEYELEPNKFHQIGIDPEVRKGFINISLLKDYHPLSHKNTLIEDIATDVSKLQGIIRLDNCSVYFAHKSKRSDTFLIKKGELTMNPIPLSVLRDFLNPEHQIYYNQETQILPGDMTIFGQAYLIKYLGLKDKQEEQTADFSLRKRDTGVIVLPPTLVFDTHPERQYGFR
jgi:hypothetical protein